VSGSHNEQLVDAPAAVVFDVIVDPSTYPDWLVGAQAITDIAPSWPSVGATFSHRVGVGPLSTPGSTTVRAIEPGERLDLAAGMGPFGEALVSIVVRSLEQGTLVEIHEVPRRGLAKLAHRVTGPAVAWALWGRNAVSLSGLRDIAEERHRSAAA
jgi:uncharacterized protein YndB with AHSA1/START domain